MRLRSKRMTGIVVVALLVMGATPDSLRFSAPPRPPRFQPPAAGVLFADDFSSGMSRWHPDRDSVWSVWHGMLRGDLPDQKQQRSLIYAGDLAWTNYALDLDVCAMRGVDKGAIVRVEGESGIGVDLRGLGYQDIVMYRREWPLGRAFVTNGNAVWHHLRIEANGHRYRVLVDGELKLDRIDRRQARPRGRVALPAYTGGAGECTVYYENVVVTELGVAGPDKATAAIEKR